MEEQKDNIKTIKHKDSTGMNQLRSFRHSVRASPVSLTFEPNLASDGETFHGVFNPWKVTLRTRLITALLLERLSP